MRYAVAGLVLVALTALFGQYLWLLAQRRAVGSMQDARSRQLERAIDQWERRGPEKYRLTITIGGGWGECRERLRIEGDSAATITEHGCTAPFGAQMYRDIGSPVTVSDLFGYIKARTSSRTCGPNGCRCDGALTIEAAYDEELGFPQTIRTYFRRDWTTMPWPLSSEFRQGCTLIGTILPEDVRVLVEPSE